MRLGRPRGKRNGHGHGRGPPQPQAAALLRVTVHLDAEKRGWVIGAQGATVKATQKATGARITLPQRGVDGPTSVEGPTPLSVLRACALIARQASAECQCTALSRARRSYAPRCTRPAPTRTSSSSSPRTRRWPLSRTRCRYHLRWATNQLAARRSCKPTPPAGLTTRPSRRAPVPWQP